MELPTITVIIPVYNDVHRLNLCLNAIAKQEYDMTRVEVRVIDNNSQNDISSVVAGYPFAVYLRENTPGSYAARNKALNDITTELVAFTDSDCIPTKSWLSATVDSFRRTDADAIGGKVELFASSEKPNLSECYDLVMGFDQKGYIEKENFSVTANLIVKSAVFEETGLFNNELMSSGDKDWCRRMISNGYKLIYCENAVVRHPTRKNIKSITTKLRRLLGGFYYQHKHLTPDKLFTVESLLRGFLPPLTSIKKINSANISLPPTKYIALIGLFSYIQLYSVFWRAKLMILKDRTPERL